MPQLKWRGTAARLNADKSGLRHHAARLNADKTNDCHHVASNKTSEASTNRWHKGTCSPHEMQDSLPEHSWCSGDVGGEPSPFAKAGGGLSKRYGAAFIWGQLVFWHKQTVGPCSA